MSNHLKYEKSPYLLQHIKNPVDWYPWSEEAFEKAKREEKPIFLSIGYSTCHWCHVMACESFEDEEVARLLNENYVSIKVDREERPDIDHVYMSVCLAMTGSGGWPLTIIMTPDQKPFYAGTYLPVHSQYGRIGVIELLTRVTHVWKNEREGLLETGESAVRFLNGEETLKSISSIEKIVEKGILGLKQTFDIEYGGFGGAPKFPMPHNLRLLFSYWKKYGDSQALEIAEKTLIFMARGGIFDQIGGGFSRYSTDDKWMVPHFEKMLYDNGLLAQVYVEAYGITKKKIYQQTAEKILGYVARELTSKNGGFYCGQDADSEGEEGKFYVFTKREITQILGNDSEAFCQWFGIKETGNFEGKSIPHLLENSQYETENDFIKNCCQRIYQYRKQRTMLHRDEKILTSWNGMMITAFSRAGLVFKNKDYLKYAINGQKFIEAYLKDKNGRLLARYCDRESGILGKLDDYAFYCSSLLELYECTLDIKYLEKVIKEANEMIRLFWDEKNGGFYFSGCDDEALIHRPKETYDGAVPSGNAEAGHVFSMLFRLTGEQTWKKILNKQIEFLAKRAASYPTSHSHSLTLFLEAVHPGKELICVSSDNAVPEELYDYMRNRLQKEVAVLFQCPARKERMIRVIPFIEQYPIPEYGKMYYLCENHTCKKMEKLQS